MGAPKPLPLGSKQLEDHLSTILTIQKPTEGYGYDTTMSYARKAAKGEGAQVLVRYLRSFILSISRFVFVATLDLSTFEQPQVYEPAASRTWNKVLQSHNQNHLLLTPNLSSKKL